MLDQPRFKDLAPIATLHLEKRPPPEYSFSWESGNTISYVVLIIVILMVRVYIISGILMYIGNDERDMTEELNEITTSEIPTLYPQLTIEPVDSETP